MHIDASHDNFLHLVGAAVPNKSDCTLVGKSAVKRTVMWVLSAA
jgi:hypothetical protein